MKFLFTVLISVIGFTTYSQTEREKLAEIELAREQQKQLSVRMQLDSAVELMGIGRYQEADEKFRYVLSNLKSVPSDLTYYFGENSFHLGLTRQSIDWLNKYIQLKGTNGKFYDQAVDFLKQAEASLITIKSNEAKEASEVLSRNYDIDCGPTGKVVCPICDGSTVVVKRGYIGNTYKTCGYCNKLGYLNCEEYNKLIRGQLKPVTN